MGGHGDMSGVQLADALSFLCQSSCKREPRPVCLKERWINQGPRLPPDAKGGNDRVCVGNGALVGGDPVPTLDPDRVWSGLTVGLWAKAVGTKDDDRVNEAGCSGVDEDVLQAENGCTHVSASSGS